MKRTTKTIIAIAISAFVLGFSALQSPNKVICGNIEALTDDYGYDVDVDRVTHEAWARAANPQLPWNFVQAIIIESRPWVLPPCDISACQLPDRVYHCWEIVVTAPSY